VLPPTDQDRHHGAAIDLPVRMAMYRKPLEMRYFEKRAYDLFRRQLVKGTSHFSIGMEAISAGLGAAMGADDLTVATYRATLARGVPLTPVLAELPGRANGLMGGKGGSMHLTSVAHACRWCSSARTTSTWSTPRSATSPPSPPRPLTAPPRTAWSRWWWTATTPTRST
jgi:TPP-dependent pyruvate/acetoin dehydrogenase alpha subunit